MGYSSNSSSFFSKLKIKKNDSKRAYILAKASWKDFTCKKNHAAILNGIESLIISYFFQN